jgi:superfamily II DNA/RNA helicase
MGYKHPTPIQEETIPLIQKRHDLIACAQTGTGKTASFLLPVMDYICKNKSKPPISALILAPTRELALQIDQQVEGLAYFTGISSIAIYGGGDGIGYEQQRRALREGVDIVIATPGRLISHINSGIVKLNEISFLVLDEADRMLDMGFKDDILHIVRQLPENRQTLLFSATMPPKIRSFSKILLKEPKHINIALAQPAIGILQQQYRVFDEQKNELLKGILKDGLYKSVIIFASTKEKVKRLEIDLKRMKLNVKSFHSDLDQDERQKILLDFKNKQIGILIGTDVLSRGIDVVGIDLVVNFDVPGDPEDYIHRIGRTARAETTGTAITFVSNKDYRRFQAIEELMDRKVEIVELPEIVGEGPKDTFYKNISKSPKRNGTSKNFKKGSRPFKKKKPSDNRNSSNANSTSNTKNALDTKTKVSTNSSAKSIENTVSLPLNKENK